MPQNDQSLIQGLVAGKESSFKSLFDQYYLVLTIYARSYVHDMDTARDIVQDMYVRLFESRQLLLKVSSLKSYLYTSVRNSCLNYIKSNQIHNKHKAWILEDQNERTSDVENIIEESELEHRIFVIVSGLPDRCKDIFRKSRIQGLRNDEIAEELSISKRTVETQISKALKIIRTELAPYLATAYFLWIFCTYIIQVICLIVGNVIWKTGY